MASSMSSSRPTFYRRSLSAAANPGRRARRMLFLGGLAVLLYVLVFGENGVWRIRHEERAVAQLHGELQWLQTQQSSLRGALDALEQPGSFALERVARENYGLIRPGERVIHVVGAGQESLAPPAPALKPAESGTVKR